MSREDEIKAKILKLITFGLAEVCIGHWASSTGRSKDFYTNAPQPSNPLIKVALRSRIHHIS